MKKIVIAIDGFSSCGKSTMAKDLARAIHYIYVDTGAMYRAVTLFALRNRLLQEGNIAKHLLKDCLQDVSLSFHLDRETHLPRIFLNGKDVEEEIRSLEVSQNVSLIAALPFVREKLTQQQRLMGQDKGIVMDGRDIGTNVFPSAELKIFVTADAGIRAQRRYDELKAKGMEASLDDIRRNVEERDYLDTHRETSPLRKAEDAITLDNSHLTIEEQREWLLERYREAAG